MSDWLAMVRELQAVAQIGLTYSKNIYDTERYEQMRDLAARMAAALGDGDPEIVKGLFSVDDGYATPKIDVRAAVFRGDCVLLVSETIDDGRWTLPGGWADVNCSPAENVVREVQEEAGFEVRARKLAMVLDRERAGNPEPHPFHIYKLFFVCDEIGPCAKKEGETGEARFFPVSALPELSLSRVLPAQIETLYRHARDSSLACEFN